MACPVNLYLYLTLDNDWLLPHYRTLSSQPVQCDTHKSTLGRLPERNNIFIFKLYDMYEKKTVITLFFKAETIAK